LIPEDIGEWAVSDLGHGRVGRVVQSYLNPDRSLKVLTGRQRFCQSCKSRLGKSYPSELKALNAILSAFD
jgi:hypothetical protein